MKFSNINTFFNFLKSCDHKKIYLWGAGSVGEVLGKLLNENSIIWHGYYDNFGNETVLNDQPVLTGTDFIPDTSAIYIIAAKNYNEIKRQLNSYGISDGQIIWFDSSGIFNEIFDLAIIDRNILNRIKIFKNIHKDKICFVVGNGPSLRVSDMEKIGQSGIIALTSNFFHQCYDKTDYRSEYHFWGDRVLIRELAKDRSYLLNLLANCRNLFTTADSDFNKYQNEPEMTNLVFFRKKMDALSSEPNFSADCFEGAYAGGTITYYMLQIAVYMGFKNIYLLGVDHTSSQELLPDGNITRHSEIQDHASMFGAYKMHWSPSPLYLTESAYRSAKRYCDSHGIKIYNATRGGRLEVFPRVNIDDILG